MLSLFLVVVAMNVAVLVYARTVMRTGEIAVRTALGATRARIVTQLFAEAFVLSGLSSLVGLGVVAIGLRMFDAALVDMLDGDVPFWMHSGISFGTILYTFALAVLAALIVGVFPALRATGAKLRGAMGSLGSGAKAQLGATWTVLIVAQVAITVAVLPAALLKEWEMIQAGSRAQGFAAGEYVATQFVVERDADASANAGQSDAAAADSTHAIMRRFIARLAIEPGIVGATVTSGAPWDGVSRNAGSGRRGHGSEARHRHDRGYELLQALRRADARGAGVHGERRPAARCRPPGRRQSQLRRRGARRRRGRRATRAVSEFQQGCLNRG